MMINNIWLKHFSFMLYKSMECVDWGKKTKEFPCNSNYEKFRCRNV